MRVIRNPLALRLLTPFAELLTRITSPEVEDYLPVSSTSGTPLNKCSICDCDFDVEEEGGILGYFGICPVSVCPGCTSSIFDMVQQHCDYCPNDDEDPPLIN